MWENQCKSNRMWGNQCKSMQSRWPHEFSDGQPMFEATGLVFLMCSGLFTRSYEVSLRTELKG